MGGFNNILLLAGACCRQDTALLRAVSLAEHNQADLTILSPTNIQDTICPPGDKDCHKLAHYTPKERQEQLKETIAGISTDLNIQIKVIEGGVFAEEIIREVLRGGFDLIMKRAETGNSLRDRIFGSADMQLLRKCPCPVWIMHANEKVKYKRIFAAVDVESETSHGTIDALNRQILQIASALSLSEFAELHIVHVWTSWGESFLNTPPFQPAEAPEVSEWVEQTRVGEEDTMKGLMATLTEVLNQETMDFIKPQLHIIKGTAQTVIRDLIQEQQGDLLVMGTVARTGISGVIMGNTAEGILENVDCSVLVIKPPDL